MDDSLGWALATFAFTMVAFGLAWVVRRFGAARDIAALPEQTDRLHYLSEVRTMRADGASLQECVAHLRGYGMRTGVARGLVLDMEREEPAAVDQPQETEWRGYRFSYPGNWRLEPVLPEHGEEPGISVEGFGSAILFLIALDGEHAMAENLVECEEQLQEPQRASFGVWGAMRGEGTHFTGPHAKLRLPMSMSVFRPQQVEVPFMLMHMHAIEEAELVTPGFDLIRDTFHRADAG